MLKLVRIASVACVLLSCTFPIDANATSPLAIKIRKVAGAGPGTGPGFIELQMLQQGQTNLAGHSLSYWQPGPTGPVEVLAYHYTFPAGAILDGTNQRRILISSGTYDGVAPDFPGSYGIAGQVPGAICFDDIDCVAWGAFTGSAGLPSAVGTPAAIFDDSQSLERYITPDCATELDATDDTNNSAVDFFVSDRTRHNNTSAIPEVLCSVFKDGFEPNVSTPLNIKIRKVADAAPGPGPAFIELQMFSAGQTYLAGHTLSFWQPGAGGPVQSQVYTFPAGAVLDGTNQRRILIAAGTWDSVAPDFPGSFDFTGFSAGAICLDAIDCVAWGPFTGSAGLPSPVGTPAATFGDTAIERHITPNCATALDGADDTDNSVVDFFTSDRTRHNNASPITEVVCGP